MRVALLFVFGLYAIAFAAPTVGAVMHTSILAPIEQTQVLVAREATYTRDLTGWARGDVDARVVKADQESVRQAMESMH